ncbi:alpha/beta hydrolase family protein [Pseudoduganella albidiflava]|uniref:Peptidase n=1 Tax=Pseudoduganella albidiflava TaxID=321983 RepID=A0A411WRU0_9BURK|nr:prolyl oligopeptidase family serine peptidase [Pseudoduganella albidiflava]QBH99472.1 S9 family peptidase [Pseudoduganella albidiflava]GGY45091.1 peptidase [Pseudoduganella albidiflava]
MKEILCSLALACGTLLPAGAVAGDAPASASIPVASFFQKSATTGAQLSPNGKFVAVRLLAESGRTFLAVYDPAGRESTAVANFRNADVDMFYWLSDNRLAFTVINVDHGGDVGKPGLFAVDRNGQNRTVLSETLVRKRSFAEGDTGDNRPHAQFTVHGFPFKKGEYVQAVEIADGRQTQMRVDARTGSRQPVKAPYGTYRSLVDVDGTTRVATALRNGRNVTFFLDKGDWRQIDSRDERDASSFEPLLYVDDTLYVSARNGTDEAGIYRFDLARNALEAKPVINAPGFDTGGDAIVNDTRLLGFRFTTDADVTVWHDERMKAVQQEVDALLPGMVNNISRGRASETPWVLVDSYADIQDHTYLLHNTDTGKQLFLGGTTPGIDPARMAPMTLERYPARDGRRIPVFVTLPKVAVPKRLPTVVLVGAQPHKRSGHWLWNAEVQFLASRGYAVLQPEPRGVQGFGRAHAEAGIGQSGRAVQDDIADAVKWAVAAGHADPARVCVAGTGYGGYAAMMALLRDADTFQCGISWSGMTTYGKNPDDARLKDIKRPALLAYGTDDEAVPYKDGLRFYQALKAGNAQAEWLEYTSSVDDWKTRKNRIDLWTRIEDFLARQIGNK